MSTNEDSKPIADVLPLPTTRDDPKPVPGSGHTAKIIPHPLESERNVCRKRLPRSGSKKPPQSAEQDKPQRTPGLTNEQLLEKLERGDIPQDRSKAGWNRCKRPWDVGTVDTDDSEIE